MRKTLDVIKEKLLGKYAAYKVLVIDEWLISDLTAEDIDFLFELSELRYDSTSTIFCTLYKQEDWLMRLGIVAGQSRPKLTRQ